MFPVTRWNPIGHDLIIGRFQIVLWPEWRGLTLRPKVWPVPLGMIIAWSVYIGWIEIRRWRRAVP